MFFLPAIFIALIFSPLSVHGQEYQLELQQIEESAAQNNLETVLPSKNRQEFDEFGYTILDSAGDAISFKIDKIALSIPDLPEDSEYLESVPLAVNLESENSSKIVYKLKTEFETASGQSIPAVKCDKFCTAKVPGVWKSQNSYGWGYSIDGQKTYRPFAVSAKNSDTFPLGENNFGREKTVLTVKLNLPKNFPRGNYSSTLQFTAIPVL